MQQPRDQDQHVRESVAVWPLGYVAQMASDIPEHPACVSLQRSQCLAHALELTGVGIASDLNRQPGRLAGVGLPQLQAALPGQGDQFRPRLLVEPCVRRMGDVLFHDGRVDGDAREAIVIHRAGRPAGLDRLREQPLRTFFTDSVAPAAERGRMDRRLVLKERLASKMLEIRILDPAGDHGIIRQPVDMLQIHQPCHQPGMRRRAPLL